MTLLTCDDVTVEEPLGCALLPCVLLDTGVAVTVDAVATELVTVTVTVAAATLVVAPVD